MKHKTALLLSMLASLSAGSSQAQNILSDTFESYTAGSSLGSSANWNTDTGGGSINILNSDEFGTSNQFVGFNDTNGSDFLGMAHTTNIAGGQAVTFSLDFIATNDQSFLLGFTTDTQPNQVLGSDLVARLSLTNGSIGASNPTSGFSGSFFSLNTAHELKMVLNDSGASINYANRSLAANSYDVWIRDLNDSSSTYVGTGTFTSNAGGYHTAGRSFNGPTPTTYFDNWLVEEGAIVSPIPEPSTLALVGGVASLLLLRRRS